MSTPLSIIFMGTPAFALPSLKALFHHPQLNIIGVITQPDRPSGRGQKLTPPPVKVFALENNIPLQQTERLRKDEALLAWLDEQKPDFIVTAAFGQILPQQVLDCPKYGVVNVHASLLPKYRGANPIQWSIINGDAETGVTTMMTVMEVDAGDIVEQRALPIEINDTTATLTEKVAELGGQMIADSLIGLANGSLSPIAQDASQMTHARKLKKEEALIDWANPAEVVFNRIRGQQPWPGAANLINIQADQEPLVLKLHETLAPSAPVPAQFQQNKAPGECIGIDQHGLWIATSTTPLCVTSVQPPGKPKMPAPQWANGYLKPGQQFTLFL